MKTRYADCDRPLMCLPVDSDPRCTLMEDWHILCRDLILDIPAGTRTDGASIPRFLWRICGHPLETPRAYAALAHDYLYEHGAEFGVSRLEADFVYHDLSRHFGIGRFPAAVEFLALRFFGASHYTKPKKQKGTIDMKSTARLLTLSALAIASLLPFGGCQTRITAEKYPERVVPIQRVVTVGGVEQVITERALIASGGWKATARSPLWADEALEGLAIGVETNGTVSMRLDSYKRDLSTNAVAMVDTLAELTGDIAGKAVAALVGAYTGGTVSASSKLGALTLADITGRAQVKAAQIAAKGAATSADVAKAAAEICEDCTP